MTLMAKFRVAMHDDHMYPQWTNNPLQGLDTVDVYCQWE